MTTTRRPSTRPAARRGAADGPSRTTLLIAVAAFAVVVVFGLVIAFGPGDSTRGGDALDVAPVRIEGAALADYSSDGADPAVGSAAPRLFGQAPDRSPVAMEADQPTLVIFLAHWCPHCQAELPLLVDMAASGGFDGIRTLAVLTGTNPDAPNFPPAAWLDREGWTGDVLVDDDTFSAAGAYGLTTYPFLVAVAGDGTVVARASGELPQAGVAELVALARAG